MKVKHSWSIKASSLSLNSVNVIRNIVENMVITPNPDKKMIPLSIGDPTTFKNLNPCKEIIDAMEKSLKSNNYNGYLPSTGTDEAKKAIANYCAMNGEEHISPQDIYLTSGCSSALDMAISLLAEPGQNILIPRPGFPLYQTLAKGLGIRTKFYNLIHDRNFEIDLNHLESQIDENTVAIVYCNPSNPCGSLFRKQHILDLLSIAEKYRLPIIADEIYEHMVFPGQEFISVGSLSYQVPILSCRGTTKRFLVPGYRLGWVIIQDRQDIFGPKIRLGLNNLCTRILGANSVVQGALPEILMNVPASFHAHTIDVISTNAELAYNRIKQMPGLKPIKPQASMYMMIEIELSNFPEIDSDLKFVEMLVSDQSVMALPGKCFDLDNFIRIVLTVAKPNLMEALNRMHEFCVKHYKGRKQVLKSIYDNYPKEAEDVKYKISKNQTNRRKSEQQKELISKYFDEMDL